MTSQIKQDVVDLVRAKKQLGEIILDLKRRVVAQELQISIQKEHISKLENALRDCLDASKYTGCDDSIPKIVKSALG